MEAKALITRLGLQPHPEGGYYRETYRAEGMIPHSVLSPNFGGDRNFSTAIYFLLEKGDYSAFHRIQSDEVWHFYQGGTLLIHIIAPDGTYTCARMGSHHMDAEGFQFVVRAGCWFASEPAPGTEFTLVGCTVAPGFDFAEFTMAEKGSLLALFPRHKVIIERLCR